MIGASPAADSTGTELAAAEPGQVVESPGLMHREELGDRLVAVLDGGLRGRPSAKEEPRRIAVQLAVARPAVGHVPTRAARKDADRSARITDTKADRPLLAEDSAPGPPIAGVDARPEVDAWFALER